MLETIFGENRTPLIGRIHAGEESDESAREQLRHVAAILLRTWRHEPDVVRVLVREIARSAEVQERIGELVKPIGAIRRIVERGQESGEFRAALDPALAAVVCYGRPGAPPPRRGLGPPPGRRAAGGPAQPPGGAGRCARRAPPPA